MPHAMADNQTIHVRLPDDTFKALVRKRKEIGEDVPISIVVRRLLDEALGVSKRRAR
jgi:hypothetical protein